MPLSQKSRSSIHRVSQAVQQASECLAASVRDQAQGTIECLTRAPFSTDSVQRIAQFQTLSRLNQCLIAFEIELQKLCAIATHVDITVPQAAIPSKITAVRAVSTSVKLSKKKSNSRRNRTVAGRNSANDIKLLDYLRSVLKVDALTARTCAVMASGSGLPAGSIGISLRNILASGMVKAGGRGMYQLGTPNTTEPITKDIAKKAATISAFTPYEVPRLAAALVPNC